MINYKPVKFKEFSGEYKAVVTAVEVEHNQYFDPDKENSTENVLNITFGLEDPETLEMHPFNQKFVAPLSHGNGLFQGLLDVMGFPPDEDGGSFDEQKFVGLNLMVFIGKNKKGYSQVEKVSPVKKSSKLEGVSF